MELCGRQRQGAENENICLHVITSTRSRSCVVAAGFLQDLSEFRGGSDMEIVVVGVLFKARERTALLK